MSTLQSLSGALEDLLGDPFDHTSPFSYEQILDADSKHQLVPWAECVLQEWGFSSELVPASLGGRWVSTEDMVRRLSAVFRRDPALGLGHGITTLMASSNIWVGADSATKREFADKLLGGDRVAVAFHEMAHGNDLMGNECSARQVTDLLSGWRVTGRKEVINNIDRAPSVLLFARTSPDNGPRSFSLLIWNKDEALSGSVDTSLRVRTSGVRGCHIGTAVFHDLVVPSRAIIGGVGEGVSTALRAFQVTRSVIPALATSTVSAAVGLAIPYMHGRHLYGGSIADLPHARMLLVRAWSGLLVADAMARMSVRALHVRPDECFLISAASKYLVPELLNDSMQELITLFGSSFYSVESPYGVIEKWVRDLVIVPIGHAGSRSCLQSLVSNLPSWARRSRRASIFEPDLFSIDADLDEIAFDRFSLGAGSHDSVSNVLQSEKVWDALEESRPELKPFVARWSCELDELRDSAQRLSPKILGADAPPGVLDLARRQSLVMAAGALLGTWFHDRKSSKSVFEACDVALQAALFRLTEMLEDESVSTMENMPEEKDARSWNEAWPQTLVDAAYTHIERTVKAGRGLGIEELTISYYPSTIKKSEDS